jgi:hypothetical protein
MQLLHREKKDLERGKEGAEGLGGGLKTNVGFLFIPSALLAE